MSAITIDDGTDDDGDAAIMLTYPDGSTCSYPYEDSSERADQLYNARFEAANFVFHRPGLGLIDNVR